MADTFTIEVATPERLLAREQAVRAQIPAKEGYIGVLPGHAALLSELGIGAMTFVTTSPLPRQVAGHATQAVGEAILQFHPDRLHLRAWRESTSTWTTRQAGRRVSPARSAWAT